MRHSVISVNHRSVTLRVRSQRSPGDEESPIICTETLRSQGMLTQSDMKIVIY